MGWPAKVDGNRFLMGKQLWMAICGIKRIAKYRLDKVFSFTFVTCLCALFLISWKRQDTYRVSKEIEVPSSECRRWCYEYLLETERMLRHLLRNKGHFTSTSWQHEGSRNNGDNNQVGDVKPHEGGWSSTLDRQHTFWLVERQFKNDIPGQGKDPWSKVVHSDPKADGKVEAVNVTASVGVSDNQEEEVFAILPPQKARGQTEPGQESGVGQGQTSSEARGRVTSSASQQTGGVAQSEKLALVKDLRDRVQRIATLCPALHRNQTSAATTRSPEHKTAVGRAAGTVSSVESVKGVFYDPGSHTAYCFVPKAGCTFWMRVFSFVTNRTESARSPWDIPRLTVHAGGSSNNGSNYPHGGPLWFYEKDAMAPNTLRFIVTRDPFSRLWSAYVDKMMLPDFWKTMGVPAVRRFRTQPSQKSKRCGHDVTFSEFVQWSLIVSNSHWEPIHQRCDPCRFRPHVVSDLHTFSRDARPVLRRMGVEWVLGNLTSRGQREAELRTLIEYNFVLLHTPSLPRDCLTETELARLLWKTFQINGYLPMEMQYEQALKSFSVTSFTDHVISRFRASEGLEKRLKEQKRYLMEEAYRSLSPELLQSLIEKYDLDFKLFGYSSSPFRA